MPTLGLPSTISATKGLPVLKQHPEAPSAQPFPPHLVKTQEQVAQHSSGDSMAFRVTTPAPTLPLPKSGAWASYVPNLHKGKLRLGKVKSLTRVTQQG